MVVGPVCSCPMSFLRQGRINVWNTVKTADGVPGSSQQTDLSRPADESAVFQSFMLVHRPAIVIGVDINDPLSHARDKLIDITSEQITAMAIVQMTEIKCISHIRKSLEHLAGLIGLQHCVGLIDQINISFLAISDHLRQSLLVAVMNQRSTVEMEHHLMGAQKSGYINLRLQSRKFGLGKTLHFLKNPCCGRMQTHTDVLEVPLDLFKEIDAEIKLRMPSVDFDSLHTQPGNVFVPF